MTDKEAIELAIKKLAEDYLHLTYPKAQELQRTIPAQMAILEEALRKYDSAYPDEFSRDKDLEVNLARALVETEGW